MDRFNFLTIMRRELANYFNSPIAYIFAVVFALLTGSLFMSQFFLVSAADMRIFFQFMPIILCIFLPAVTMRLWAEEKKENTYELLLTFPMKPESLVAGKFLASFIFFVFALAATVTVPIMLMILGKPDLGPIIGGYIGTALVGALFLAIGIFVSALFRDQIIAFIVAMLCCFLLFFAGTEFIAASLDGWIPGLGSFLRRFLGVLPHFSSFQRGVLDLKDILYFVIGTAVFLVLNGFWIEGRMRPNQSKIFSSTVGILIAIFITSNWLLAGFSLGRFDLTQGKIYTVSSASKKILGELKSPVTLKYYVSPQEKMPTGLKTLEQDVMDKLDELRIASRGKLQYKVFHMEAANIAKPANDKEEESLEASMERKGIQPFQVQSIEADEMGVRLIYSTLSIAYKEKTEETIPRVVPGNLDELEYLVLSKIYRMTLEKTPKIAVLAPYQQEKMDPALLGLLAQLGQDVPETQTRDNYRILTRALKYEGYDIARVRLTDKEPVPPDTDTLVILEPENLTEEQETMISEFLADGGSVFLAVQNYEFEYMPSGRGGLSIMPVAKNPNVNAMLDPWGLKINDNFLLDREQEVLNIGSARMGPFDMSVPVKLPLHIRIGTSGMNAGVSITSRLESMLYLWGSAITIDDKKVGELGLKKTVLLSAGRDSWTIPAEKEPFTPRTLAATPAIKYGPFPVAVMLEGKFPGSSKPSRRLPDENSLKGKLILIGAATPFQESVIRVGGHLNFFINSIDALCLGEDLIKIRAKRPVDRAISPISTPAKVGWRFFASLLAPILIAVFGGLKIFSRTRTKQNYMQLLQSSQSAL